MDSESDNRWGLTRRSVLRVAAGGAVLGGTSGSAVGGRSPGGSTDRNEDADWTGRKYGGPSTSLEQSTGTAQGCPSGTFGQEWDREVEPGIDVLSVRPGSPDGEPVYVSGVDFFSSGVLGSGKIYALDRDDGSAVWERDTDTVPTLAVGDGDSVYYATTGASDSKVVSLDAATGAERWTQTAVPDAFSLGIYPEPSESTVYVAADGPSVVALDDATGNELWSVTQELDASHVFSARSGPILYMSSLVRGADPTDTEIRITVVDLDDEAERWAESASRDVGFGLSLHDDTLFVPVADVGENDGGFVESELLAYDVADGTDRSVDRRTDGLAYLQVVDGGDDESVYASTHAGAEVADDSAGTVVKFDLTTDVIDWEHDVGGAPELRLDGESVYVVTFPGDVVAINDDETDPNYGGRDWTTSLDDDVRSGGLSIECDTLYTGTDANTLYSLDPGNGQVLSTYSMGRSSRNITKSVFPESGSVWATSGPVGEQVQIQGSDAAFVYRFPGDGGSGGSGQHDSGVSQEVFDAVDRNDDGSLTRADVINMVNDYVQDGAIDGVPLSRTDVIGLVRWYVRQ